jgi:hypothetical protein
MNLFGEHNIIAAAAAAGRQRLGDIATNGRIERDCHGLFACRFTAAWVHARIVWGIVPLLEGAPMRNHELVLRQH